ncbi:ribosome-associated translation inhibitor RaiA [Planctomycetota bacterium]|nr:ribosome-associated translation inhibitor RaiA [Planctomycetota bacterium]
MYWQIRGTNIRISNALKQHTESKLIKPLGKFASAVNKIVVRFSDVDLSNRKSEIKAKALVVLNNGRIIEIEQKDHDYYSAINHLADRIKLNVTKSVSKQRDKQRRAGIRRIGNILKKRKLSH